MQMSCWSGTNSSYTPEAANVRLYVYNVNGQVVATLVNDHTEAGYHSAVFNSDNLPSGVYFANLQVGGNQMVKKMVLSK